MGDSDSTQISEKLYNSSAIETAGKIIVAAILSSFFVVAFVIFVHLYARWLRRRRGGAAAPAAAGGNVNAPALNRGLDPSVLKTIPVIEFDPKEFRDELECAVCLSLISEGEKMRFLPKCNHGFHVNCIDMWFKSHSTCPLCRNTVLAQTPPNFAASDVSTLGPCLQEPMTTQLHSSLSSSSLPLGVGAKGLIGSTSGSSEGKLVIDIPGGSVEDEGEQRSPVVTTMRSLKRLLSRGKRVTPSSPSSSSLDVERGGRS